MSDNSNLKPCCGNCVHLLKKSSINKTFPDFYCKLHHCSVSYPDTQYCGDDWMSIITKIRIEKLKELGI